jgi:hypothetical protein
MIVKITDDNYKILTYENGVTYDIVIDKNKIKDMNVYESSLKLEDIISYLDGKSVPLKFITKSREYPLFEFDPEIFIRDSKINDILE